MIKKDKELKSPEKIKKLKVVEVTNSDLTEQGIFDTTGVTRKEK